MDDKRLQYLRKYRKEKLRRVPLDLKPDQFEAVRQAAQDAGESMNGYIKAAIAMRMKKEGKA